MLDILIDNDTVWYNIVSGSDMTGAVDKLLSSCYGLCQRYDRDIDKLG